MRRRRGGRLSGFAVGVIAIVVTFVVVYLGFTKSIPFRHHYTIQAGFRSSNNIALNSPVRIAGVNVGKVTSVEHLRKGGSGALVKMEIQKMRQTTDTLAKVQRFADVLGPTAQRLRPAVRQLDNANRAVRPFAREAAPIVKDQIRPFVRAARPLVRDLRPAANDLAAATPDLTRSFVVLNHLFNMLGYNPNGREGPDVSQQVRDEGYLFYIAWVTHDSQNLFNTVDAHNSLRPVTVGGACNALRALAQQNLGGNEFILGLTGLLTNPSVCG